MSEVTSDRNEIPDAGPESFFTQSITVKQPPYPAILVANEFLQIGQEEHIPISPMKIQKLLYLAHGYHLHLYDKPLIEEAFEAWKFGPVVSILYHKCKHFDRSGIKALLTVEDNDFGKEVPSRLPDEAITVKELIKSVWVLYGMYDPMYLSRWTHVKDGPWERTKRVDKLNPFSRSREIDNGLIQEYFRSKLKSKDT